MTLFVFRMALKNELLKYWYILECICLTHQILSHGEFTSINFLSYLVSQTMSSMPYCSLVNLQCFIILDNPFFQNKSTIVCICVIIDIHVHSWRESNQIGTNITTLNSTYICTNLGYDGFYCKFESIAILGVYIPFIVIRASFKESECG